MGLFTTYLHYTSAHIDPRLLSIAPPAAPEPARRRGHAPLTPDQILHPDLYPDGPETGMDDEGSSGEEGPHATAGTRGAAADGRDDAGAGADAGMHADADPAAELAGEAPAAYGAPRAGGAWPAAEYVDILAEAELGGAARLDAAYELCPHPTPAQHAALARVQVGCSEELLCRWYERKRWDAEMAARAEAWELRAREYY